MNDQLIVQQSALDGPIHIDGQEKSLFINDYTKEKFNLTEGSIVDVAYLVSEEKLQIAWRHNLTLLRNRLLPILLHLQNLQRKNPLKRLLLLQTLLGKAEG
ncbi:hypothetical protein [Bacillus velezensis]|uniref:hypothetical protein n=1 Tax=Bacillus velezensis TaxID=492670 RepID=UPI00313895AA